MNYMWRLVAISILSGMILAGIALAIGGVTGIICAAILIKTIFMCMSMHSDTHFKLWGDWLEVLSARVKSIEHLAGSVEYSLWSTMYLNSYRMVVNTIYIREHLK